MTQVHKNYPQLHQQLQKKLNLSTNENLIQQQISKAEQEAYLIKPNQPTEEAIKRAQFVDRTYVWNKK